MKKFVLYLLLLTLSAISSVRVGIRRSPPGDILEPERPNVTLHCELLDGEPRAVEVESVVWFYQGEVLRQTPDEECRHQPAMADFLHQELGSGLEGSSEAASQGEAGAVLLEEELIGGGEYIEEEVSGSGEPGGDLEPCGAPALPGQLLLQEVSRQLSGQYACAAVSGGVAGPRSEELQLTVECKLSLITSRY